MKILLAQTLLYLPTYGGANKGNRAMLEALAAKGYQCRVVAPGTGTGGPQNAEDIHVLLSTHGARHVSVSAQACSFTYRDVEATVTIEPGQLRALLKKEIADYDPDWILVASEDPGHSLLDSAVTLRPERTVYVSQTTSMLPFGPSSMFPGDRATALIREARGIICLSRYLQTYIQQWGKMSATVIRMPIYGDGPFPVYGNFDSGHVLLINPCQYKGIEVFLKLAAKFPEVQFAAVPSWGTTTPDRKALGALRNVQLLPPSDDTDEILRGTKVLLAPSIWDEAFGHVVVEAMLRGIPVLASNTGGLPEAKLGVDYVLPVTPISTYENKIDECSLPVSKTPQQDIGPWADALHQLLSSRANYDLLSSQSRQAALAFASEITTEPFERYLVDLGNTQAEKREEPTPKTKVDNKVTPIDSLSQVRRALLALRLQDKRAAVETKPQAESEFSVLNR